MKHLFFLGFIFVYLNGVHAQTIKDIHAYVKEGIPCVMVINDSQQVQEYTIIDSWNKVHESRLPFGQIQLLEAYHQLSGSMLVFAMEDQSIWSTVNEKLYQLSTEGLPEDLSISQLSSYTRYKMTRPSASVFLLSEKNGLWRYREDESWDSLHQSGIAPGLTIQHINSFQKIKGVGYKSGFIIGMSDQSIYKRTLKDEKWKRMACNQLPKGYQLHSIDSYLTVPLDMGYPEGYIVACLEDGSIWTTPEKKEWWHKLDMKGLPQGYIIKKMRIFQTYHAARILLLLEDNTIWWYDEGIGFSELNTTGLVFDKE